MALRKSLTKRLLSGFKPSPPVEHSPMFSPYLQSSIVPPNAAKTNFHCEYLTSPETPVGTSFHSRVVNHSASIMLPNFISIPLGEKIRDKLRGTNLLGDHARINFLLPPSPDHVSGSGPYGMTVDDARKLLRLSQGEKLKGKLRQIPKMSISYSEFLRICVESCGHEDQGTEFAKRLDESGHVIVFGNAVFLRPEQVAKTMETLISQSMGNPKDARARSEELEQMEKEKSEIDQKAQAQVRGELYCGLGFLLAQTAGFIRLTFWELSWDVMEPICFFVTSIHFALAYGFFLRTSTEPTFQGYFYRRFKTKQKRLMKAHNFDLEKYNELRKAFYSEQYSNEAIAKSEPFPSSDHSPDCTCGMYIHHHS